MHVYCKGFHYCKNISRVSANHLVPGVSLERVVGINVLYPSSIDHRNAVGSIPDGSGCRTFIQTVTWMWAPVTFPWNASFAEASFGAPVTLWHAAYAPFLECLVNGVHLVWPQHALLWSHRLRHTSIGCPMRTYIDQLCDDYEWLLECLPNITQYRNGRRERVMDIRASTTRCYWYHARMTVVAWAVTSDRRLLL